MFSARGLAAAVAVLGVLAVLLGVGAAPAQAATTNGEGRAPLVVVGFSGVRWTDVSEQATPALASMTSGAIGTVAVRSVFTAACPADGWLGLSAGRRATDFDGTSAQHASAACAAVPSPAVATDVVGGPTTVPGFEEFRRIADGDTFGAVPGTLGSALSSVDSLAVGPGAAIALADTSGRVPDYVAASTPAEIGGYVQDALENGTRVVVVDAGVVRDPADLPSQEQAPAQSRAEQVAAVDARVAAVQRAVADSTGPTRRRCSPSPSPTPAPPRTCSSPRRPARSRARATTRGSWDPARPGRRPSSRRPT